MVCDFAFDCAGTMLLLWIGEIISEYNIGNGISLIIFAGIVAQLPTLAANVGQPHQFDRIRLLPKDLITALFTLGLLWWFWRRLFWSRKRQRNIPVSYAKRVRGNKLYGGVNTHLPLRINQAGVIPIIFAISILLFPGLLANFFANAKTAWLAHAATNVNNFFQNQTYYGIMYLFWSWRLLISTQPLFLIPKKFPKTSRSKVDLSQGLRPGRQTADFLYKVLNRITLAGAVFLGLIAVLAIHYPKFYFDQISDAWAVLES
jgi:preprotein translocase subunit SecY